MRLFAGLCAVAALGRFAGAQAPADSIHLTRAEAIASALANNAQLDGQNQWPSILREIASIASALAPKAASIATAVRPLRSGGSAVSI